MTTETAQIHTAMVLAAGLGTRMRPLTEDKPKPLVPLAERPLIDHVLERLHAGGIGHAVVNVHYLGGMLIDHMATRAGPRATISDERERLLDTAGGIINALPVLGPNPFLIHNSDSVWIERGTNNIAALISAWDPGAMDALLMLADGPSAVGYSGSGDFNLAEDGTLSRMPVGTTSPHVYCGVSIMKPESFAAHDSAVPLSLNVIWDDLIARGRLYGLRHDGLWMHVGDPVALAEAEAAIAAHTRQAAL